MIRSIPLSAFMYFFSNFLLTISSGLTQDIGLKDLIKPYIFLPALGSGCVSLKGYFDNTIRPHYSKIDMAKQPKVMLFMLIYFLTSFILGLSGNLKEDSNWLVLIKLNVIIPAIASGMISILSFFDTSMRSVRKEDT